MKANIMVDNKAFDSFGKPKFEYVKDKYGLESCLFLNSYVGKSWSYHSYLFYKGNNIQSGMAVPYETEEIFKDESEAVFENFGSHNGKYWDSTVSWSEKYLAKTHRFEVKIIGSKEIKAGNYWIGGTYNTPARKIVVEESFNPIIICDIEPSWYIHKKVS